MTARAELVRLFAGDLVGGDWEPCHSPKLADALCEAYKPGNAAELRTLVYGSSPADAIGTDGPAVLEAAFKRYAKRARAQKRKEIAA